MKKVLSLLLCLALLSGLASAGAQAAGKACDCSNIPIIFVPGFDGSPLYLNYGTPQQTHVPAGAGLQTQIVPIAKDLLACAVNMDIDKGTDAVVKLLYGLFGEWQMDERGESVKPVTTGYTFDETQDHTENRRYWFHYDFRMVPTQSAAQLNEYIQQVKEATGHGKVAVQFYSQGGIVAMAYLARYGAGDIEHIIITMGAHNGLTLASELFNGRIAVNGDALANFLRNFGRNGGPMALVNPAADLFQSSGLADLLTRVMGNLLPLMQDKIMEEALVPLLMHYPAVWSFIPGEDYRPAKETYLGDPKYSDFVKMIDSHQAKAGPDQTARLLAAAAKKTKVSIVVGYGSAPIPLTVNTAYDGDLALAAAGQSAGAVVAEVGKTLPSDYRQKVKDGHHHISPDRRVDASACVLPEQTWFVDGMVHTDIFLPALDDFVIFLADSKKQPTIFTSAEYPQFMARLPDGAFSPAVVPASRRLTHVL